MRRRRQPQRRGARAPAEPDRALGAEQLRVFFEAVDSFLPTPASIVLIGGAAAALHGATSKIHRHEGLDFDTLVDRFEAEMRSAVGDPQRIGLNFLELIERLYGELKRVSAAQRLA